MAKKRLHVIVHGRVQGVFFRAEAQKRASAFGLTGWVRNNPDGTVELVAEGEERELNQMLLWCREGPSLAHVDKADAEWEECKEEFEKFSIKY